MELKHQDTFVAKTPKVSRILNKLIISSLSDLKARHDVSCSAAHQLFVQTLEQNAFVVVFCFSVSLVVTLMLFHIQNFRGYIYIYI